jgi:methyl-accepting chemotaxis protein
MKKVSRLRLYLSISLGFGLIMGILFPLYASFFVQYPDGTHKILFQTGCVIAGLIVGGASYLIGRIVIIGYLRQPVERLLRLTSSKESVERSSSDPLTELFRGIDSTGATLSGIVSKLKLSEQQIKEIQNSLDEMLNTVHEQCRNSIRKMESTKKQIAEDQVILQKLTSEIKAGANRIAEMKSYSEGLYGNLSGLVENLTIHFKQTDLSETQIIQLGDSYRELSASMKESAQRILHFKEKIGNYGKQIILLKESVSQIDNFAEETQIYSINANIEASNAGDAAGKGFRVIAEGIARLAEGIRGNASAIGKELSETAGHSEDLITHAESRSREVETLSLRLNNLYTQQTGLLSDLKGKNSENRTLSGELQQKGRELNRMKEDLAGIQQAYDKLKNELGRVEKSYSGMTGEVKKNQELIQHQILDFQTLHDTFNRLSSLIQEQNRTVEILNVDKRY